MPSDSSINSNFDTKGLPTSAVQMGTATPYLENVTEPITIELHHIDECYANEGTV